MNYLHIGLPKTATTTLQEEVFPNLEDYLYLGKRRKGPNGLKENKALLYKEVFAQIKSDLVVKNELESHYLKAVLTWHKNSFATSPNANESFGSLKDLFVILNKHTLDNGQRGWCYSDESLVLGLGTLNCNTQWKPGTSSKYFLEELHDITGMGTTIIVVFRDPVELITSFYYTSSKQRFISFKTGKKIRPLRFDEYLDKQQTLLEYGAFQSILDPCFQQDFLNKLKQCMPVIARDFEQLKQGDDVIKTLGITDSKSHPALKDLSTMNTRYEKPDVLKYMAAGYKKDTMTKEQIHDHALETLEARGLIKAFEQQRIQF